jgi:hypothetical protein
MSIAILGGVLALAALQGGLVLLPDATALGRLRRFHSPAWAMLPPGMILVGTFGVLGLPATAVGLVTLAAIATPLLAAISALVVVRVPQAVGGGRAALVSAIAALTALAVLADGWVAALAATVMTAAGCLALGVGIVRLIPQQWLPAAMLATAAVDAALLALGPGHSAVGAMADAQGHFHGPTFDSAAIGPVSIDYPDLVLAAILGGTVADDRGRQRRAAMLLTALAGLYGLLLPVVHILPATVPIAVTYFLLHRGPSPGRAGELLQRAQATLTRRLGTQHGGSAIGDAPLRRRRPVGGGFVGRGA